MSLFPRKTLYLGLTAHEISVLGQSRSLSGDVAALGLEILPTNIGKDGYRIVLERTLASIAMRNTQLVVTLGDELVRYWIVEPPPNVASLKELQACVTARFELLFHDKAERWHISADYQAARPFIACAIPASISDGLTTAARANRHTITSVASSYVRHWNRHCRQLPADHWLWVANGPVSVLSLTIAGYPRLIRHFHLTEPKVGSEPFLKVDQERRRLTLDGENS